MTSGFFSAAVMAALTLSTTAAGVPFGAASPNQVFSCTPGQPSSAKVGNVGQRCG